jgi:hypothetical protein
MEGDTQWIDSYVTEETYTYDPSIIVTNVMLNRGAIGLTIEYFTITGKRVGTDGIRNSSRGIYLVRDRDISGKQLFRRHAVVH